MSIEDFKEPRTPESRTPYVLLGTGIVGLLSNLSAAVRENVLVGIVAAVAVAVGLSVLAIRFTRKGPA